MSIGNTIRMFRVTANPKQSELAERSGISVSYLSLLENDKREPTLSTIEGICKGLGIHVFVFLFAAALPNDMPYDVSDSLSARTMTVLRELRSD